MKLPKILASRKFLSRFAKAPLVSSPRSPNSTTPNSPTDSRKALSERSKMPFQLTVPSPCCQSKKLSSEITEESSDEILEIGSCSSSSVALPKSLVTEFEEAFRQFDANGDGKISAAELGAILCRLGENTPDEEATLIVKDVDANGDGFIDLQEFINSNAEALDTTGGIASLDELRATFHIFDLNRNGYITPEELHSVLVNLGDENSTVDDCLKMIKNYDRNGDGFIDFEEFKSMMTSICL